MLVEFRIQNYRCFKDEQVLSLNASSDQTLSDDIIVTPALTKMKLLRSVVIYGPTARSNLVYRERPERCNTLVFAP